MTSNTAGRRVGLVAYLRVSTDAQVVRGHGLDVQREAITEWARSAGHRVSIVLADEGLSGTLPAHDRPALCEALALVAAGQVKGIVVHHLDRLARELTVQEAVLAEVWRVGGRMFTVDQGEVLRDDPDDPMRTFVRQVMGAVHQLDRAMITKRLRDGRRAKAARGGHATGPAPYGYRLENRERVPDTDEQATVRRIVALHREGRSLRDIIAVLDSEHRRPRGGGRWHPRTVASVLDRRHLKRAS